MQNKLDISKLIVSIALPLIIGFLGSIFTSNSVKTWYLTLIKPSFNPPGWLFGPVWTILYILMGVSLYLIWSYGLNYSGVKVALIIFGIQLILNFLWSILFFGLHNPLFAFINIVLLWISILIMIILFFRIYPLAAYLQIPYLLWVTFASVLNFSIFILN
jgi:tryptophan-rich sensory protein